MCDRCNLFYCGDCALSSNGKCSVCGNTLRSPKLVLPFEVDPKELYKGRGQPGLVEAVRQMYMEPMRAMRRLLVYTSLTTAVLNATLLFLIMSSIQFAFLLLSLIASYNTPLFTHLLFTFLLSLLYDYAFWIISWLTASLIYYIPARMLGGKGSFLQQAYLLSYIMLATFPFAVFVALFFVVSIFSASLQPTMYDIWGIMMLVAFLITGALYLYSQFLVFVSILEIHQLGRLKSLASLLVSIFVPIILGVLLLLLNILSLGAIRWP